MSKITPIVYKNKVAVFSADVCDLTILMANKGVLQPTGILATDLKTFVSNIGKHHTRLHTYINPEDHVSPAGTPNNIVLFNSGGYPVTDSGYAILTLPYWSLTGNAGTVDGTNFLGTIDDVPLTFRVNNAQSGRIERILVNTMLGYSVGVSITTGNYNNFYGSRSGEGVVDGARNQYIGCYAGRNNISGNSNVAIGDSAMYDATTSESTAIGTQTMYATSGLANIAIGYAAMNNTTTGYYNVCVGNYSLYTNVDGYRNTAIGYQSMYSNVDGYWNVAVGSGSLYANTSGHENVAIGANTMLSNGTGHYNVAVGNYALIYNDTGGNNVAMGTLAMYANTDGNNNVAVGYEVFDTCKVGSNGVAIGYQSQRYANDTLVAWTNYNTSVGYQALRGSIVAANNTGNYNTVFGYQSLMNATSGGYNTCVGVQSGYVQTTGTLNTFIGHQSGYSNTIGTNNTFIGHLSGYSNINGTGLTAVGCTSLYANTNGINNTCVGWESLGDNIGGSDNCAFGMDALILNTTGNNNTAVGSYSGLSNLIGSGSVFLGYQAGYYETGNNKLFIDNAQRVNEATARYSSLIYGVFNATVLSQQLYLNTKVSINPQSSTVVPTAYLHLAAGTTTAATAPLKLTTGTNMTVAEAGAMEFTTDDLYFTITTAAARKGIILNDGANLTSGFFPIATTNGRLIDSAFTPSSIYGELYEIEAGVTVTVPTHTEYLIGDDLFLNGGDIVLAGSAELQLISIGGGIAICELYTDGVMALHETTYVHTDIALNTASRHTRLHSMSGASDHTSPGGGTGNIVLFNAAGYPVADSLMNFGVLTDTRLLRYNAGATQIENATVTETAGALGGITTISMSNQLTNTLADGTTPFLITSTTLVTNLNAEHWNSKHLGAVTDGKLVRYNSTGTQFETGTVAESAGALSAITTISMSGQLTNTLAIGTSPFAVTSTTVNTNLNADLLDGQHGAYYATAASISGTANYVAKFATASSVGNSQMFDDGAGVGVGMAAPTAVVHIKAGTATAGTAPLKFTSGVLLAVAEAGTSEYNGTNFYFTPGATRNIVAISPTLGLSVTITTAALTGGGAQGSMTFVNGILTAQVQST